MKLSEPKRADIWKIKFLAVGEAPKAIFSPTPGLAGITVNISGFTAKLMSML